MQVFILGRAQGCRLYQNWARASIYTFPISWFLILFLVGESVHRDTSWPPSINVYMNSGNWLHCKGSHAARASSSNKRGKSQETNKGQYWKSYSNPYFCSGLISLPSIMIWDYSFSGEISPLGRFLFGKMVIENCFIWVFY